MPAIASPAPAQTYAASAESLDMSVFARVPDITRKLNRQNTADAVLNTDVPPKPLRELRCQQAAN